MIAAWAWAAFAEPSFVLPERSTLPHGQCENGATGADGYFLGDFRVSNGQVTGTETWVLFANEAWKAKGGRDCAITWRVTGTPTAPSARCATCTQAITFAAEPDVAGSDCPAELLTGRMTPSGSKVGGAAIPFRQTYDVRTLPDGTAVFSFASSGREIGRGAASSSHYVYVSGHQCKFF